ncbi:hypothetical protein VE02_07589 [Pseudogymnoascus sp. 03VT05]|nr:hypothetical protein VE02_07589 [Pseudogymnoascus sp. 03VT05]
MEGQQGIKRKAEASPERTGGAMTSKLAKVIEVDSMEDITTSTSTSAFSSDSPKSYHSANTSVSSQSDNGSDDEDEDEEHGEDEDEEYWGDEHEHDDDDDDDIGPPEREVDEQKHNLGGSEVTFKLFIQDEDEKFKDWMQTIHVHCSSDGKEIGGAFGGFVRRDRITANFWRDMEKPSQELSSVAFELFDRYGRLKREFVDHNFRKGSGCWGSELDLGPLFIIEHVRMERDWQCKGVGKKMVESLIAKASAEKKIPETLSSNSSAEDRRSKADAKANKLAFTLAAPGWLNGDISQSLIGKTPREQRDIQFATHDVSVAFYRSIGFRRIGASSCFGLAVDPNHEAHRISINDDFNPPEEEVDDEDLEARHTAEKAFFREEEEHSLLMELLKKRLPLHHAALTFSDAECVKHYEEINKLPNAGEEWKKVDKKLNTVLHIASCRYKLKAVEWLLKNADVGQTMSSARNIKGYTALEGLQSVLEAKRTTVECGMMTMCISDNFSGFPIDAVNCLAALEGIKVPSQIQSLRLKFGCTCGQCVDGFFSARMKEALLSKAEVCRDMLDEYDDGRFWVEMHRNATRHVAPDILRNFTTNRSLRHGFVNIFGYAADAMLRGDSPSVQNVLDVWINSGEWPPVTRSYFQRGGTAVDALRVMFEAVRYEDHWAGKGRLLNNISGVDEIKEPAELAALPHCRNDLEFGMVALMCGMPNL